MLLFLAHQQGMAVNAVGAVVEEAEEEFTGGFPFERAERERMQRFDLLLEDDRLIMEIITEFMR